MTLDMQAMTRRVPRGAWRKLGCALLGACLFSATVPHAATDNGNLSIGAKITDACVIDSVSDMNFGTINSGTATNYDTTSAIRWRCQRGTVAIATLNGGTTAGDVFDRAMAGPGGSTLAYQIYVTAPRTLIWGDRRGTYAYWVFGRGMGPADQGSLTAYGRITNADLSTAGPGSYSDVVTLTLNF
ncbi:MAG: Csu type fimbrial protein [Gammaproteobacteria bacterium]